MYKGDGVMDFSTLKEDQFNEVVGQLKMYNTLINEPIYDVHKAVLLKDGGVSFFCCVTAEEISSDYNIPLFAPQYYNREFESGYEFMMVHY